LDQVFSYAAITGIGALIIEAIILLFKTETIERVLLNERKKLLLDLSSVTIIGFAISLIIYNLLIKSDIRNSYSYIATFIISWGLGFEVYYVASSTLHDIGFGKNYYIEEEKYGRLYLIKRTNENHILLADKPKVKNSTFVVFENDTFIEGKKILSESKKKIRIQE
jgi:hypothetical protein